MDYNTQANPLVNKPGSDFDSGLDDFAAFNTEAESLEQETPSRCPPFPSSPTVSNPTHRNL